MRGRLGGRPAEAYATRQGGGSGLCVELSLCLFTYILAPVPVPEALGPTANPELKPQEMPDIKIASSPEVTLLVPAPILTCRAHAWPH